MSPASRVTAREYVARIGGLGGVVAFARRASLSDPELASHFEGWGPTRIAGEVPLDEYVQQLVARRSN